MGALGQADRLQRFKGSRPPVARQAQANVVDDLLPRQQARVLEHQAGVFLGFAQRRGTGQQLAATGLVEPGEQAQQGALAAAAAPDNGDELPGRNMQVDVTQHLALAEGLLQVLRRQRNPAQQSWWRFLEDGHAPSPLLG
ncbi:hypothetical protein D3C80_1567200 [compost metagenome]